MRQSRSIIPLILISLLIIPTGCVNFDPVVDSTEFHVIGANSRDTVDPIKKRVVIRVVHLEDYLQNSQVVERLGPNRVRYLAKHRWAGSLDTMVARAIADQLEEDAPGLLVTLDESGDADIHLDITLLQFALNSEDGTEVALEWRAEAVDSGEVISEGRSSNSTSDTGPSVSKRVALLESELRKAAGAIGGSL